MKFSGLEARYFEESKKREIIFDSLYFENSEDYLTFTVCRNPVERLLSVYKYLGDMFQRRMTNANRLATKWSFFHQSLLVNRSIPSWQDFLDVVVSSIRTGGLTIPINTSCDLSNAKYHKIIKMETFNRDVKAILSSRGLSWLPGSHMNSHSTNDKEELVMKKVFNGVNKQILRKLIDLYRMDFEFCGYHESLQELQSLL